MTRIATLIAAAALATAGLAAQASVPPAAAPADGPAATLAMGPGPWCGAPQDNRADSADKPASCDKVARNIR